MIDLPRLTVAGLAELGPSVLHTVVRRGSFRPVRALVQHIERYLDHWNADPRPFVWTKTPAQITKKAVRRPHDFGSATLVMRNN